MNKHIKKELEKCRIKLPEYDDTTTYLLVERNSQLKDLEELKVGHYYLLEVADYIIKEPSNFTLSSNWNGGTVPPEKYLRCEITDIMGKMIKVSALGNTTLTNWSGFLPRKSIEVVKEYE